MIPQSDAIAFYNGQRNVTIGVMSPTNTQGGGKDAKPIEIIDQQNQAYYNQAENQRGPMLNNQLKILTPQNNINIRGKLIPGLQNQKEVGRRAYSNLRGGDAHHHAG
jgi:hypothetical protein